MISQIGYLLLVFALCLSLYAVVASLVSIKTDHRRLFVSAKMAFGTSTCLCLLASLCLVLLFFNRDYSVLYVYKNSSNDLPWFYTLSAFWSSLEGSHLLWTLLLSFYSLIALLSYPRDLERPMAYVIASLAGVLTWMLFLGVTYSDPFAPIFPPKENGLGMNELLQNPYVMFHPPSLFTGYTALAIPFGYSIAALCMGEVGRQWGQTVRRWTLFAWIFLTIGIFLGGRWAYVELGWAGYWAWDPVENSSLMPWLFTTGALHSLLVQEKLGQMKRLTLILSMLSFFFSFLGTFITRSGVISSIHAFAQSPVGPNYLLFLSIFLLLMFTLYIVRAPYIVADYREKLWGFSKESALMITQFLLITFATIVFIGTLYPIISEMVTGVRFNIQAPYFNSFSPYLGFSFIAAIAIGNLLHYSSPKVTGGHTILWASSLGALPCGLLFSYGGSVFKSSGVPLAFQLIGIWLCFASSFCLLGDLFTRLKRLRFQLFFFIKQNTSYLGSLLAHLGIIVGILGFLGNYRGIEKLTTLNQGESVEVFGYNLSFLGIQVTPQENVHLITAPLEVRAPNGEKSLIRPARAKYPTKEELLHEIDFLSTFWHDLYVSLVDFDNQTGQQATLEIHVNPTVRLVWQSGALMALGGGL